VLWLPNLRVGASWTRHDGQLQEIRGDVFAVSRSALFSGGGAQLQADTADAFFTPLAARQVVSARAADSLALTNNTLLDASRGYYELVRANALYAVQVGIVDKVDSLDQLAQSYLRADKLKPADAGRIRTDRWIRQQYLTLARQNVRVASAQLARFVRLDPFVELVPVETEPVPLSLVSPDLMQTDLAATALTKPSGTRPVSGVGTRGGRATATVAYGLRRRATLHIVGNSGVRFCKARYTMTKWMEFCGAVQKNRCKCALLHRLATWILR